MKTWMVEGQWKLPPTKSWPYDTIMPVRSVVQAKTKKDAKKGANKAIHLAVKILQGTSTPEGEQIGEAQVLYPI